MHHLNLSLVHTHHTIQVFPILPHIMLHMYHLNPHSFIILSTHHTTHYTCSPSGFCHISWKGVLPPLTSSTSHSRPTPCLIWHSVENDVATVAVTLCTSVIKASSLAAERSECVAQMMLSRCELTSFSDGTSRENTSLAYLRTKWENSSISS